MLLVSTGQSLRLLPLPPALDVVSTSLGPMPWSALERRMSIRDNADVCVVAWEFWHEGAMVHRSVDVRMKRWPGAKAQAGKVA